MKAKFETPGEVDILISFDRTGSMYPCIREVRRNIDLLNKRLFGKLSGLRIGIIRHGDYCDPKPIEMLDLTTDPNHISHFVNEAQAAGGGDAAECYELVLHQARSAKWTAARSRALVLIGDDVPHPVNYRGNSKKLDWKNEATMLAELGVRIYAVQCLNYSYADSFYAQLAQITSGAHVRLNQFRHIEALLTGIAYQQHSPEAFQSFEQEYSGKGPLNYDLQEIFGAISGRKTSKRAKRKDGLISVDPARFQVFNVEGQPQIREFVENMGISFQPGRGFYPHVSRTETIQARKEVILEDLGTGELFTGSDVREKIGLPYGIEGRIRPNLLPGYRLWIQSTSYNRVLRDKLFMYEVPEKAAA